MKKLLILMLVLGLASAANAAVVLSLNGNTAIDEIEIVIGETVVVDVYNTDASDINIWLDIYYTSENSYELSNAILTDNAGDMSSINSLTHLVGDDCEEYWVSLAESPESGTAKVGSQFEVDIKCLTTDTVLLELYAPGLVDDATIIQIIPEPMTIALLGLGGLLLRRRR